jgi:hypothetical protein
VVFLVLVNVFLILNYEKTLIVKHGFQLFFASCLLGSTYALPSIFFVFYILLFLISINKLSILQFVVSCSGMLTGVLMHLSFHYLIGGYGMLRKILVTTISFSKNGVLIINKLVESGFLNESLKNLLKLDFQSAPFSKNNLGYFHFFENNTFLVIVIISTIFIILIKGITKLKIQIYLSLIFIALIPVYMNVVGRFLLYYQWMFLIPLFIIIVYNFSYFRYFTLKILLVFVLVINMKGTRVFLSDSRREIRTVSDICSSIRATDTVYCDYLFYYNTVSIAKKVYLYQNLVGQNIGSRPSKVIVRNRNLNDNRNVEYAIREGYQISDYACYENSKDTFFLFIRH